MSKNSLKTEDEIDLLDLIILIYKRKLLFIFYALLGLSVGLLYTYQHIKLYEVNFKINVEYPILFDNVLHESAYIKNQLAKSEINTSGFPTYSLNYENYVYKAIDDSKNIKEIVINDFKNALKDEIINIQETASQLNNDSQVVRININNIGTLLWAHRSKQNILSWTNKDIININIEDIVNSLKIEFGPIKELYPKPLKHGSIGIFLGFLFAALYLLSKSIFILMRESFVSRR